ncbi:MAG: hypothetical protein ACT4PP_17115 [Sporichthyaceae bacterium]
MTMSAHERKVLAATARELAAADAALARALRTWTDPADRALGGEGGYPAPQVRADSRGWARARGWLRDPLTVAAAGGLLFVGSLLATAGGSAAGSPSAGVSDVATFTEQIPTPLRTRMQGP